MLTITITLLVIASIAALILSSLRIKILWRFFLIVGLILATTLHLLIDGIYHTLAPIYIITAVLTAIELTKLIKKAFTPPKLHIKKILWVTTWRTISLAFIALSVIATWNFGQTKVFSSIGLENQSDFSNLSWSQSFDQMNSQLSQDYAFGKWKKINWQALHAKYSPQIIAAEKNNSEKAYYQTLRDYIYNLPDGHIELLGGDYKQDREPINGGYGLNVMQLEDKRVIASLITPAGPAEQAGLTWGAEILSWNGIPIADALNKVSIHWFSDPIATLEGQHIQRQHLLTRGKIGAQITLTFRNPDQHNTQQATLTATDDQLIPLLKAQEMGLPIDWKDGRRPLAQHAVESRILPSGYGYLKINYEIPTLNMLNPVGAVAQAAKNFIAKDVPGVIIDLRQNRGGIDAMAPMMMAYFCSEPVFYEQVAYMDKTTKSPTHVIETHTMQPANTIYTGPLVMLIDNHTISTGEGFPLIMQRLQRGPIMGFYGTYGSFGMVGSSIKLPGGYQISYPNGAALDKNNKILLDSNHLLEGGVQPDIRLPITEETVRAIFVENRDIVLERAIANLQALHAPQASTQSPHAPF